MRYFRSIVCLLIVCIATVLLGEFENRNNFFVYNCGCGAIPYPSNTGFVTPKPILRSPQVWSFVTEPKLHPMKVTINTKKQGIAPGLLFVAPYAFSADATYGQSGALIMDNDGNPVWFRPLKSPNLMNTDFRVQTLYGKSVLTFWQGTLATPPAYTNVPAGSSEPNSCYYILDSSYRTVATVTAHNGFTSDIHEFLLTPNNTALLLSTKAVPMDLTPYGGPQNGYVQDFAIQEIDVQTNQLLFFWSALDHIPLTDSFEPASSASSSNNIWDAYHLNAIGITDTSDDILVSGRNTWTIYRINKPTKNFVWQLGGVHSDFVIDSDAQFSWQHDARFLPNNVISMFDDNCCQGSVTPGTPSRGLVLQLDLGSMTASLKTTYYHDPVLRVSSQGNVQSLDNGNKFIGWGQSQYYSEFKNAGNTIADPSVNMVYDAKMPGSNYTYRAYRNTWVGTPYYPPRISAVSKRRNLTVYASWNGSTETTSWQVLAGKCPHTLKVVTAAFKTGFETAIAVATCGPYFKINALNAQGQVIGSSEVIKVCS